MISAAAWGLSNAAGPNGSNVQAVHALGYTGQGVNIGLLGLYNSRTDHHAFFEKDQNGNPVPGTGRVLIANPAGVSTSVHHHDTQIAGILVSSGDTTEPFQIGIAPGAIMYNSRIDSTSLKAGLEELIVNRGCRVVVSGFAFLTSPSGNDGTSRLALMCDYYAQTYDVVFALASGNSDSSKYPYHSPPTIPGDAYNGITTGGLIKPSSGVYNKIGSYSLAGPTYDGRRKPEVCAPSPGQRVPTTGGPTAWTDTSGTTAGLTSWAVPHTAGVAAVLLSFADTTAEPDNGRSEVIKAVIINSAFPNINAKNGMWTDPANQTWHTDRGYGRLDAQLAFDTLSAPKITPGATVTQPKGWAYNPSPGQNNTHSYFIRGSANQRLVMTATWHRLVHYDPSAFPQYTEGGRINLTMTISTPQGAVLFSETDTRHNLRKADILLPEDGFYAVEIKNTTFYTRNYALAFEILDPLPGDLNMDYCVNGTDLEMLMDSWLTDRDLNAFNALAAHWMTTDPRYLRP